MTAKKRLDIEFMRILACFFVIFNHTKSNGFFLFASCNPNSLKFWIYLFISIFCTFSVPLFYTISGSLLLNREGESLLKFWKRRIFKMVLILVVWSFFYYFYDLHTTGNPFNFDEFFDQFYNSSWNFSFWYLYAYIPMLMGIPLLRKFVKSLDNKDFLYLFALAFSFSSLLPSLQYFFGEGEYLINHNFRISWVCSSLFLYPCLGYFLQTRLDGFWNKKRIGLLWIINISAIVFSSYLTCLKADITGILNEGHSQTFHKTFVFINCIAIFVTCKYLFEHISFPNWINKLIESMGGCTLGIYLLHIFIKSELEIHMKFHFHNMFSTFLYCGLIFILGYLITLVLKQIPIISKFV